VTRLAHVGRAAHVDFDLAAAVPGLRVPGRQRGGLVEHRGRQLVEVIGMADDDVASWGRGGVEPEVSPRGHSERQRIVLRVACAHEDLEALDDEGPESPAAASHRTLALPRSFDLRRTRHSRRRRA
jgi:hypothetical protein